MEALMILGVIVVLLLVLYFASGDGSDWDTYF